MRSFKVRLLSAGLLAVVDAQQACRDFTALTITNVSLPGSLYRRGFNLNLGSTSDNYSFVVDASLNTSFVYSGCTYTTGAQKCRAQQGGLLATTSASTQNDSYADFASRVDPSWNLTGIQWYPERVSSNGWAADQFTIGATKNDFVQSQNTIGMGAQSTFLQSLKSSKVSTSPFWSLNWGWNGDSPQYQSDGSLVLGGYDSEQADVPKLGTGSWQNRIMTENCTSGLVVFVSDILVDLPGGKSQSLIPNPNGPAQKMCIKTGYPIHTFASDVFDNFQSVVESNSQVRMLNATSGPYGLQRSTGIYFGGILAEVSGTFDMNITYVLSTGVSITMPSHQFLTKDVGFNSNGQLGPISNSKVFRITRLELGNEGDLQLLGHPFLSSAYLMVQPSLFAITASTPKKAQQAFKAFNQSGCTSNSSSDPASGPASGSLPGVTLRKGLSTGTIAGIVIGGLAIIMILLLCALCILRMLRRKKEARELAEKQISYISSPAEMYGDQKPYELLVTHDARYVHSELPSSERPQELSAFPRRPRTIGPLTELPG